MYFVIALLVSIILLCLLTPYENFDDEIEVEMPANTPEELGNTIGDVTSSFNQMTEDAKYDTVDESQL
jgi:hypothetical protein